jgi:hypothetical protein
MFSQNVVKIVRSVFKSPQQSGQLGLELELEGENLITVGLPKQWVPKTEGSLHDGYEYITAKPGALKNIREKVNELQLCFKNYNTRINSKAYRGSTHIHLNIQEESFHHVLGCLIVFTAIEPLFLRLCGPTRDGNLFCMSSYDTGDLFFFMKNVVQTIASGTFSAWPRRGKYASLNLETITQFGSLEFRCFPTSIDPEEIYTWCNWVVSVMDVAKDSRERSFSDILHVVLDNPSTFASRIFGHHAWPALLTQDTLKELITMGCETAFELSGLIEAEYQREELKKKSILRYVRLDQP